MPHLSRLLLIAAASGLLAGSVARAQGSLSPSLSPNLSNPLSESTSTQGFDSQFDPSTSNLTNPDMHTAVSDDTHSQLLGSAISPLDNAFVSSAVQTAPHTDTLTDSQATIGANSFSFGGRRNQSFSAGGTSGMAAGLAARQGALEGFGGSSAAFTGGVSGKAAFSGQTSSITSAGTALGFSGEGIPIPTTHSGIGPSQTLALANGTTEPASGYYATDPVLSGSANGYQTDLELTGDMPSPSSETSGFFAEGSPPVRYYQYDDGQTPPISVAALPGPVLGVAPEYTPNPSGFPDSTKGLAGLAPEAMNERSPFDSTTNPSNSPFAPVSEGNIYALTTLLNPNLHAAPASRARASFEEVERRAQEQRLTHGVSISQSASIYRQDLRNYREDTGRRRRPTLQDLENQNQVRSHASLMQSTPIR